AFKRHEEAGATGLEPATSGVTGRRSNQLSYAPEGERSVCQARGDDAYAAERTFSRSQPLTNVPSGSSRSRRARKSAIRRYRGRIASARAVNTLPQWGRAPSGARAA